MKAHLNGTVLEYILHLPRGFLITVQIGHMMVILLCVFDHT